MKQCFQKILTTAAILGTFASLAVAQENKISHFNLYPNPQFLACLGAPGGPTPTARVTVSHGEINDTLVIEGNNFAPNLGFDMFTVERSNLLSDGTVDPNFTNVGLSWYQTDLEADASGHFKTRLRLEDGSWAPRSDRTASMATIATW